MATQRVGGEVDATCTRCKMVRAVRQDKMDVAFKTAERTLVQGRSSGTVRPSFAPPHRPEDAVDTGDER